MVMVRHSRIRVSFAWIRARLSKFRSRFSGVKWG